MISEVCFAHDTYESLSRNCINYQFVLDSFNSEYLQKEHYLLVDARPTVRVTCWWAGQDNAHYSGKRSR